MMFVTDDPIRDFHRHDREQQDWEDSLPHCECCGDAVDDYVYDISGEILCIKCLVARYRRDVEDYLR